MIEFGSGLPKVREVFLDVQEGRHAEGCGQFRPKVAVVYSPTCVTEFAHTCGLRPGSALDLKTRGEQGSAWDFCGVSRTAVIPRIWCGSSDQCCSLGFPSAGPIDIGAFTCRPPSARMVGAIARRASHSFQLVCELRREQAKRGRYFYSKALPAMARGKSLAYLNRVFRLTVCVCVPYPVRMPLMTGHPREN